jgi:hypothetical protein
MRAIRAYSIVGGLAISSGALLGYLPVAALGLGALAVVAMARRKVRTIVDGASWAVPLVLAVTLVIADVYGTSVSEGSIRYLGMFLVLVSCLLLRGGGVERAASRAVQGCAVVLFLYGITGVAVGRFWLGTEQGALPIVLPLVIVALGAVRPVLDDRSTIVALKAVAVLCTCFALMCVLARGAGTVLPLAVFNHEKAFLVVLGPMCAIAARSWWLSIVSAVAAVAAFVAYPAATYATAVVVVLATCALPHLRLSSVVRVGLAVAISSGSLAAILYIDRVIAWTSFYFALVGKTDNGDTRLALYRTALAKIEASPVFSEFFSGSVTVVTTLSGRRNTVLPVHNDYLSIALGGGVAAALLLMMVLLFANGLALRAIRTVPSSSPHRRAVVALQSGVNAAAVVAVANPVWMNPGSSTAVYALLLALISLSAALLVDAARARPAPSTGPAPTDVPTARVPVDMPTARVQVDAPTARVQVDVPTARVQLEGPTIRLQAAAPSRRGGD